VWGMNSTIVSTTAKQVAHLPSRMTPAIGAYLSKVNITAQATYDRWPEANGMRRELWELAAAAGISSEQVVFDLAYTPIECDGGRWWATPPRVGRGTGALTPHPSPL